MPVVLFNVREELFKLSNGQPTAIPVDRLARMAADMLLAYKKADEEKSGVNLLEKLHQLQDPR